MLIIDVLQFHFATVLSPWIRRALIAGGFGGSGSLSSRHPTEIVQVVSYGDVRSTQPVLPEKSDVEHGISEAHRRPSSSSLKGVDRSGSGAGPITLQDTPFFHFDVVSAVRAAEARVQNDAYSRTPSMSSVSDAKHLDGSS